MVGCLKIMITSSNCAKCYCYPSLIWAEQTLALYPAKSLQEAHISMYCHTIVITKMYFLNIPGMERSTIENEPWCTWPTMHKPSLFLRLSIGHLPQNFNLNTHVIYTCSLHYWFMQLCNCLIRLPCMLSFKPRKIGHFPYCLPFLPHH